MTVFAETSAATADEITLRSYLGEADTAAFRLIYRYQDDAQTVENARRHVRTFEMAEWAILVGRFVERAHALDPDAEIWVNESERLVTAITPRDDLDHELALYAAFVDLSRSVHDPSIANLSVRTQGEDTSLAMGQRVV